MEGAVAVEENVEETVEDAVEENVEETVEETVEVRETEHLIEQLGSWGEFHVEKYAVQEEIAVDN